MYVDEDGDGYGDRGEERCDLDMEGYVMVGGDCNDGDPTVNPGATEICDGIDNNCDTLVDEDLTGTYYLDWDGDGYGSSEIFSGACSDSAWYVDNSDDCDDDNFEINPGATEICDGIDNDCDTLVDEDLTGTYYLDSDGDGYGDPLIFSETCSAYIGYVDNNDDCDDTNFEVNPGVTELCNEIDDDCDGETDEGLITTYYLDMDGDGYGNSMGSFDTCLLMTGMVEDNTDCDDDNPEVNPGASETCNNRDDNCNGEIDEGVMTIFYADVDRDTYGDLASFIEACGIPDGYVEDTTDCDDAHSSVHPGATEICDSLDNDCDTLVDEDLTGTYYLDSDEDGYGDPGVSLEVCLAPAGYVDNLDDCNDTNPEINPGATEICDSLDNDCDGTIDESDAIDVLIWYADTDTDGYGNAAAALSACSAPEGYVADHTDCNDMTADAHPDEVEVCDEIDNDCDGDVDESDAIDAPTWYHDRDGDSYGNDRDSVVTCNAPLDYVEDNTDCNDLDPNTNPGAREVCEDKEDNDCDGSSTDYAFVTYYYDGDGDGYGDPAIVGEFCSIPEEGYVEDNTDCDDTDFDIHPDGYELFYDPTIAGSLIDNCDDGKDNDCNGYADLDDLICSDEDGDDIPDGADALFPCDPDDDGANEALCLWTAMAWESPWSESDCVLQSISDVEYLDLSATMDPETVPWGGDVIDVCVIDMTGRDPEIYTYRWISVLSVDGESAADPDDCRDWVPMDLTNFCHDFSDSYCATSTKDDGCGAVGGTVDFRWTGTSVTPD